MEVVMGKRALPIAAIEIEEPDFPEVGHIGSLELPTDDEFVCSGDDVREEFAMLGGHDSHMEHASSW
jgi:hypothetical protein